MGRERPQSVSVVVATYNGSPWISDQLAAIISQEVDIPFEIVIADNGSTDDTLARCRTFLGSKVPVRLVDASKRRGKQFAQRLGVLEATGELIAVADQDDVCAPGWLQALVKFSRYFDMVGGRLDVTSLNPPAVVASRPWIETFEKSIPYESTCPDARYAVGCNCAIWRSVFLDIDEPENDLPLMASSAEDRDMGYRMRRAGRSVGFAPGAVVAYRLRDNKRVLRRQLQDYGVGDAMMVKRYRSLGARGDPLLVAVRKWLFLVPRAAKARLEGDDLHWARSFLAVALGRLRGSVRFRVMCL